MESATAFTGVSGKGYVVAGVSALFAAWLAAQQASPATWLGVWMLEMVLAGSVALALTAAKTEKQGKSLWSASGRKLLLAFIPAMSAGKTHPGSSGFGQAIAPKSNTLTIDVM